MIYLLLAFALSSFCAWLNNIALRKKLAHAEAKIERHVVSRAGLNASILRMTRELTILRRRVQTLTPIDILPVPHLALTPRRERE